MAVDAVIFDWGGTLTPWRSIDPVAEWRALAEVAAPERVEAVTAALCAAAEAVWKRAREQHQSATMTEICALADVVSTEAALAAYRSFWDDATYTDPDVPGMVKRLRADGIKVGVLSNTVWPRTWHEEILDRDGVLDLFDGAVYTSEIPWTKPHPEAFLSAARAVGVGDPMRCVFVGDRLFDDVYGAHTVGMKAVFLPHSDIPASQIGHTVGEPDAVIDRLSEVPEAIARWR